jgi:hypothetical protein
MLQSSETKDGKKTSLAASSLTQPMIIQARCTGGIPSSSAGGGRGRARSEERVHSTLS